jgi:hypothetical protein
MKYMLVILALLCLKSSAEEPDQNLLEHNRSCLVTAQTLASDIFYSFNQTYSDYQKCKGTGSSCINEKKNFESSMNNLTDKSAIYLRFCEVPCSQ